MARRVVLYSPLDPVELATRMLKVLGGRKGKPKNGVTGQGTEQDMMLFVYRYASASGTRFNAIMDPDERGGTRIEGSFGVQRSMECGLIVWIFFLSFFIATGIAICSGGGAPEVGIPLIAIPGIMILVPIGLWWFGTRRSASDETQILKFLADTVQAHPA